MDLVVDGRRAYAYTGGKAFDPALPCVVFVHGALNDHSVWTLYARYCAHHGRSVLALDLLAHGCGGLSLRPMSASSPPGYSPAWTPPARRAPR